MKNKILLVGALLCAAPVVPLSFAQAQQSAPRDFKANVRVPVDGTSVVYNGKTFTLSGDLHGVLQVKGSGANTFIKGHLNAQGISVSSSDGTSYRGVGAVNVQARTDADGATFKGEANIGLIGKGQAPNTRLKLRLSGSVDAQGQVTISVLDGTLSSK